MKYKPIQKIFRLIRNYPKVSSISLVFLIIISFLYYQIKALELYQASLLPKKISIQSGSNHLDHEIEKGIVLKVLKEAKSQKFPRRYLFNELDSKLKAYKLVDTFWIRMGLDQTLYIHIKQSEGLLVLRDKNQKTYLIDKKMNVIEENIPAYVYPSLPRITFDHIENINSEKLKINTNLAWLSRYSDIIRTEVRRNGPPYKLEDIVWNEKQGFSLSLSSNNAHTVKVILGDERLEKKSKRLRNIMSDLKSKNLDPEFIDLSIFKTPIVRLRENP